MLGAGPRRGTRARRATRARWPRPRNRDKFDDLHVPVVDLVRGAPMPPDPPPLPSPEPPTPAQPRAAEAPDERARLDHLFSVTYEELRRLASTVRRSDPAASITPTALVNEAWLKLARSPAVADTSPLHFKRIAARAMRQVLIEAARRRAATKRGGSPWVVSFDDATVATNHDAEGVLALDSALTRLAELSPRQGLLVEARFFGGLTVPETAELLEVSESTVLREWRIARAWLARELDAVAEHAPVGPSHAPGTEP